MREGRTDSTRRSSTATSDTFSATAARSSTSGGLKAVEPLVRATPPMKVWESTRLSARPNTSLLPGGPVWMPTGDGNERGSMTVSEIPVREKNQSSVPFSGRSPLRVF